MSVTPRLVGLEEATRFLYGRHPSRLGIEPVFQGRDSAWDLVELNLRLNQRLAEKGVLPPDAPAKGVAANDTGQTELQGLWAKLNEAAPEGV
jgi:hypothetical protein